MSDEVDALLKKNRRKPLFESSELPHQVGLGRDEVMKIIPHRDPLLFVDGISAVDFEQGRIAGFRAMRADDPVFQGHFPDMPLYPGNFTIESIGQIGLCMHYFVQNSRFDVGSDATPVRLVASKIAGALFLEPIRPGDRVTLLAQRLAFDSFGGSILGQAVVGGKVAAVCVGEVIFL